MDGNVQDVYTIKDSSIEKRWVVFTLGSTSVTYYNSLEEAEKVVRDLDKYDSCKHTYIIAELVDEITEKPLPKMPPVYKTKLVGALLSYDFENKVAIMKVNGVTKELTKEQYEKRYGNCLKFEKGRGFYSFYSNLDEMEGNQEFPVVLYSVVKDKENGL